GKRGRYDHASPVVMSVNLFCGASPGRPPPPATVKTAIANLHASIVSITGIASCELNSNDINVQRSGNGNPVCLRGIGVLIHPTLVLTTHSTIPSPASIKDASLSYCLDITSLSYVKRKFVPEMYGDINTCPTTSPVVF
ncbi:hypothetical protein L7F22_011017, partial [Adiantum nelumboides]|nr:hypothetical protein [Adiantum nelumboides]